MSKYRILCIENGTYLYITNRHSNKQTFPFSEYDKHISYFYGDILETTSRIDCESILNCAYLIYLDSNTPIYLKYHQELFEIIEVK